MKLLTKKIETQLRKQGDTSQKEMKDITVYWKLFDCWGNSKWYIYEYDPDTEIAHAMCLLNGDHIFAELGAVSIRELKYVLGRRLERDKFFSPKPLEEVYQKIKKGEFL